MRSVLPLLISVVMVIGGLTIGFIYGVDAVAALVDPAFGLLMSEGWWRRAAVALIAWPVGLTLGVAVGYQVGFLLSLPLLDRLALAVERHDGWTVEGRSLGLKDSAFCVSVVMASWLVGSLVFMVLGLLPGVGVVFVAMGWLWSALCVALGALDPSLTRAGYGLGARLDWCAGICRLSWRSEPWRASGLSSLARTQGSSSAARDWRRACSSPKPQIQRTDHVQQQAPTGVVDPLIRAGADVKKPNASARRTSKAL